jgi:hypothetical protein
VPVNPLAATADALEALARVLRDAAEAPPAPVPSPTDNGRLPWSALVWVVPGETRLNVRQLAEALNRPRSWIYHHRHLIPHRRHGNELVFTAGEIRGWVVDAEVVEVPPAVAPLVVARRRPA